MLELNEMEERGVEFIQPGFSKGFFLFAFLGSLVRPWKFQKDPLAT
jgi:hypothetical protein